VRCVPPGNKPTPAEIKTCRPFLDATIASAKSLAAIVALGRIAHDSVVQALGRKRGELPFAHGREHVLLDAGAHELTLFDSYHCSRYNTNTGVLTPDMFQSVFARVRLKLDSA
jgi:uracil-DNA glycosylase family 4